MGNELQILIIEADKDRIDEIQKVLTDEMYKIETSATWDDALQKISCSNFNLIVSSNRIANGDVSLFLDRLVRTNPNKLNLPFIICRTSPDIQNEVERILSGKRLKWIDKESTDFIYELEWLIMDFFPRIFSIYRRRLHESINGFKDAIAIIDSNARQLEESKTDIKQISAEINDVKEEQETIKGTYIKTESIFEMTGLMVGGITLAIALAVGLITILFDKKLIGIDFELPLVRLLIIIALEIIFTFVVCYLTFSRRSQKIIEDKVKKELKKRITNV